MRPTANRLSAAWVAAHRLVLPRGWVVVGRNQNSNSSLTSRVSARRGHAREQPVGQDRGRGKGADGPQSLLCQQPAAAAGTLVRRDPRRRPVFRIIRVGPVAGAYRRRGSASVNPHEGSRLDDSLIVPRSNWHAEDLSHFDLNLVRVLLHIARFVGGNCGNRERARFDAREPRFPDVKVEIDILGGHAVYQHLLGLRVVGR